MLTASALLDVTAALVAVAVLGRRVWFYRRIRVDHVLLFTIGHLYYLSLGSLAVHVEWQQRLYRAIYLFFDQVPDTRRVLASAWSLGLLVVFLCGSRLASTRRTSTDVRRVVIGPMAARRRAPALAAVIVSLGMALGVGAVFRATILAGYSGLDAAAIQNQSGRGVLSASAVLVGACALHYRHVVFASGERGVYLARLVAVGAVAIPSLLLLVGGGRLYVATFLIAYLVWSTHTQRSMQRRTIAVGALLGFVALTGLGAARIGEAPTLEAAGFYASSESVLTSVSAGRYLASEPEVLPLVALPKYLVSDLVNVVPSVILPNKADLRLDPADEGIVLSSSLGAQSLWASALLNFGVLGSLVVGGLAGFGLGRLQLRVLAEPRRTATLVYSIFSASILFSLFRDPFSISIVRWLLTTGCLTIGAVVFGSRLLQYKPKRLRTPNTAAATLS